MKKLQRALASGNALDPKKWKAIKLTHKFKLKPMKALKKMFRARM